MKAIKSLFISYFLLLSQGGFSLNEKQLIGYWEVIEQNGTCLNLPISIQFDFDGSCVYSDNRGTIKCCGYVIGEGNTLHLFSNEDFSGQRCFTMINLSLFNEGPAEDDSWKIRIAAFGANWDSEGYVVMKLRAGSMSAKSKSTNNISDNTEYQLNGVVTKSPKGVLIQSGKKRISAKR